MRSTAFILLCCLTAQVRADCQCEETAFATIANAANVIVYGTISAAQLRDKQVHFVVDVLEVLRGTDSQQHFLSTEALPGCGIPVVVGMAKVFFMNSLNSFVDRCTGTADRFVRVSDRDAIGIDIIKALKLANYSGGDPQEMIAIMGRGNYGPSGWHIPEERIIDLLTLVSTLKPNGIEFEHTGSGYLYRDIEIQIKDGAVVGIQQKTP